MSYTFIDTPEALAQAAVGLKGVRRIALDCEAAGFHRFSDRLCLVQLSTPDAHFLLDPLALDLSETLRPILEDPLVQVVMHGPDYDVRLLDRDLDIRLEGLFDTQVAASLLGAPAIGLSSLLEHHLSIKLSKAYQRADWAQRPLTEGMLAYAANDTRHLMALADILLGELEEKGREGWAQEECHFLEAIRWEEDGGDPIIKVKGAKELSAREVTALREALSWRNEIAESKDRAPFRVAGDPVLLSVVLERPGSLDELEEMKGISPRLAKEYGRELLIRLERVDGLPDDELNPYPRFRGNGPGRPTPEEEALANRIRDLRTGKANELGLDRGVLLSNSQIMEIVRQTPRSAEELVGLPGIRRWQAELIGSEILRMVQEG
jgi:ribonuclease D